MSTPKVKTKFPTKAQMNAVGIHNGHNLASLTSFKLYIEFTPAWTGRSSRCARFHVMHIGFNTDPQAHWQDYGKFSRNEREAKLAEAIAWVKDPFGSYQDANVIPLVWAIVEGAK